MIAEGIDKNDVQVVIQNPVETIKDDKKNVYKCFGEIYEKELNI